MLISVTTIPAAANVGVSAAYRDWNTMGGSAAQLAINLGSIVLAGTAVLSLQRLQYLRRKHRHQREEPLRPRSRARTRSRSSS